ncbi:MAG: hypothetical protein ACYDGN_14760 [Acidimicrobiales bacterium]
METGTDNRDDPANMLERLADETASLRKEIEARLSGIDAQLAELRQLIAEKASQPEPVVPEAASPLPDEGGIPDGLLNMDLALEEDFLSAVADTAGTETEEDTLLEEDDGSLPEADAVSVVSSEVADVDPAEPLSADQVLLNEFAAYHSEPAVPAASSSEEQDVESKEEPRPTTEEVPKPSLDTESDDFFARRK